MMAGPHHPVRYHKLRPFIDIQELVIRSGVLDVDTDKVEKLTIDQVYSGRLKQFE